MQGGEGATACSSQLQPTPLPIPSLPSSPPDFSPLAPDLMYPRPATAGAPEGVLRATASARSRLLPLAALIAVTATSGAFVAGGSCHLQAQESSTSVYTLRAPRPDPLIVSSYMLCTPFALILRCGSPWALRLVWAVTPAKCNTHRTPLYTASRCTLRVRLVPLHRPPATQ